MGNVFYVRFSLMNDTFLALQLLHNRVLVDRLFYSHTNTHTQNLMYTAFRWAVSVLALFVDCHIVNEATKCGLYCAVDVLEFGRIQVNKWHT